MSTLSLSEVKASPSEIADEVDLTHERVHVARKGHGYVMVVAAADLAAGDFTTGDEMARQAWPVPRPISNRRDSAPGSSARR